ncbi:putative Na(+)/H(+) antiporter C15A10,06 [Schizosaccharomyces pombe 972h-] [Rhizoctonia solani]|uniref:Sodium/hydrogen exchanger n=1 Tax=Rhizoctonia solani TaxID=456999 RepID=A0A0K6FZ64_9AGAM|nr:putative Na(+)/H(+) antiporter C15A10,06 [Schizosaccharomyces pombe 972h-] [Rhizoctonia solani]
MIVDDVNVPETPVEEEELYSAWALTILCILLILSLWTSYYVQIKRIKTVHETVLSIFAGMVVGLIIRLSPGHLIREMLTFKHTLFFNLLLPPIILNSGYELKQDNFFRNFGTILTFAFVGTFISAVGLGVLVYIYSFLGLEGLQLSLLECLIFGSTLSATDPVTILAIFNQHKVDPKLYTVIFGESILNDAVSIVMYETLSQFHGTDIYMSSFFRGVGIFLLSFSVSMALGVAFGLACSLMLKHSSLTLYPGIESCLVALIAYTSYFFSNGMHMSGIVSLLFCGITLKHYAYHTMSRRTQRTTRYMFSVLAQLSENFIFIYLGLNLFTQDVQVFKPIFILVATISVISTRYAAVFPLSELINLVHRARGQRQDELPHSYQMMLFWAGLRGAVGVALAAGFKGENANALRTSVLVVVVLTVILFGGTTARMLEVLGIRTGVEDDDADSDEEPLNEYDVGWGQPYKGRWKRRGPRGEEYSDLWNSGSDVQLGRYGQSQGQPQASNSTPAAAGPSTRSSESSDAEEFGAFRPSSAPPAEAGTFSLAGGVPVTVPTFETLDQRYLLPLFSNPVASRNFHARKAAYRRSTVNLSNAGGERDIGDGGDEDEGTGGRGTPEPVRDLRGGRLSVPSTPGANSPRFGATRQLGGSSGLGEATDDARRRRDSTM